MSSIACQKQWTLSVVNPAIITAYWTCDEATGDLIDSVGGVHMFAGIVTEPGAPALYGNGVHFTVPPLFGFQTVAPPQLAYTAPNDWSAWGWFKIDATGVPTAYAGPSALFGIGTGSFITIWVGSSANPEVVSITRGADSVDIACTLATWHFFHLCYNGSTQKYGYSIDNAAITYFPTVIALTNAATGGVTLENRFNLAGDVYYDEIGIITNQMLTSAQQTYLYNAGVGRTWPIALP